MSDNLFHEPPSVSKGRTQWFWLVVLGVLILGIFVLLYMFLSDVMSIVDGYFNYDPGK